MSTALDCVLSEAVASNVVPGLVALVADRSRVLYEGAFGRRNAAEPSPADAATLFRIASMTKIVTAISFLRLLEQGLVELDTPVGDVLGEFDSLQVLDGFEGDRPILRAPASRATMRQLLTHTSGLAYDIWNARLRRYYEVTDAIRLQTGARAAMSAPLVTDPGTHFNYGTSTDWIGLVVERLSGQPLEAYWRKQLFEPLGMHDTTPHPDPERRARTAPVHAPGPDGAWVPTAIDFAQHPEFYAGGHCLYSTARDYLNIQQLLLNDGDSPAGRILRAETVDAMFRNQMGGLEVGTIISAIPEESADVPLPGRKWGLGLMLDPDGVPGGRSPGSGSWMGGFNTFFWVDRARGITAALYTQTIPFYDGPIADLARRFETAIYAAL